MTHPEYLRPIRAYKHVHPEFADAFRKGTSIKLGTFEHYRTGEGARVDQMEGSVRNLLPFYDGSNALVARDLTALGAFSGLDSAKNPLLHNNVIITECPPGFIFCASIEPNPSLVAAGQFAFEITDMLRFANKVREAAGFPMGEPIVDSVTYAPRHGNISNHQTAWPNPFVKDASFEWEKELRIFWPVDPRDIPGKNGVAIVSCPEIAVLVRPWSA